MKKRLALIGLDGVRVLPLKRNDAIGYGVTGELIRLPNIAKMSLEEIVSEQDIFADDTIYAKPRRHNGYNTVMEFVDAELQTLADLGLGAFDEVTGEFKRYAQSADIEFALAYRRQQLDNRGYRMYKSYVFIPTGYSESDMQTAGANITVSNIVVTGLIHKRVIDGEESVMKDATDSADLDWLNEFEGVGVVEDGGDGEGEA